MKNTAIFYGSSTGYTADVATRIAKALDIELKDVYNVAETAPSAVGPYDVLIFGSSTWGVGDLQDDWYDFIDGLEGMDLKGKKIAIFGCGDETMSDSFCGAMGVIYDKLQSTGADFIGAFDADGYDFSESPAKRGDKMVGLCIDEINHPDLTDARIARWAAAINS